MVWRVLAAWMATVVLLGSVPVHATATDGAWGTELGERTYRFTFHVPQAEASGMSFELRITDGGDLRADLEPHRLGSTPQGQCRLGIPGPVCGLLPSAAACITGPPVLRTCHPSAPVVGSGVGTDVGHTHPPPTLGMTGLATSLLEAGWAETEICWNLCNILDRGHSTLRCEWGPGGGILVVEIIGTCKVSQDGTIEGVGLITGRQAKGNAGALVHFSDDL